MTFSHSRASATTPANDFAGADQLARWAEQNLRQLGMYAARALDAAASEDERIQIACVGVAIAQARQKVLPLALAVKEAK